MKKSIAVIAILGSAAMAASASASVLINEPFNYSPGALLGDANSSTGTSWQRAATSATFTALNVIDNTGNSNGLGSSALAITGVGNNNGGANRLGFAPSATPLLITSGTVYYSFDMQVTATTGSNTGVGGFITGLNNTGDASTTTNPSVVGARIQIRQDAADTTNEYDLELTGNIAATSTDANWSAAGPFNVGDTLFIVAAYSLDNNTSSLWINPDPSTFGAGTPPTATETGVDGTTKLSTIGSIIERQSAAPYLDLGDLRVGTTWADVVPAVPEPASLSLLGLGAIAGLARRRRV